MECIVNYLVNLYPKDPTAFWTMILVGATLLLFLIAWIQLSRISKTGSADFIHRFKVDFFGPETRNLIMLVDQDSIKFKNDALAGFEVVEDSIPEIIKGEPIKKYYSGYEMDDFLLGHFEDLGLFEKKGFIKIDMIYEEFGWYIETVRGNCQIDRYIKSQREEPEDKDIYDKFDYIHEKCKSFGRAKIANKSLLLWKIKWWFCHKK